MGAWLNRVRLAAVRPGRTIKPPHCEDFVIASAEGTRLAPQDGLYVRLGDDRGRMVRPSPTALGGLMRKTAHGGVSRRCAGVARLACHRRNFHTRGTAPRKAGTVSWHMRWTALKRGPRAPVTCVIYRSSSGHPCHSTSTPLDDPPPAPEVDTC